MCAWVFVRALDTDLEGSCEFGTAEFELFDDIADFLEAMDIFVLLPLTV